MAQITCKELSALSDLLSMEENTVAKCKAYAAQMKDGALKNHCEQMAAEHQHRFDALYANLK